MRRSQQLNKSTQNELPHLECVTRISNIPLVETGVVYAGQMYTKIKNSNSLMYWTLGTAESSFNTALEVAIPTIAIFEGPLSTVDKILCKSLDIVEQRVPNIHLPPQMMYFQTKQYVSSKFVRPMLKRADSVKQMGNSVLASKYTEFAADKLDEALNVADMYVDKYLPDLADQAIDEVEATKAKTADETAGKAVQTIHHVDRFSRKLQRRLTKRTLAEAKALKERSQESIHVLLYVAELIAKDPKQAMEKARQLWNNLSLDEPENQARPATLEQLIVMLTRESARRVVHLVNFTRSAVGNLPVNISKGVNLTTRQCRTLLDQLVKSVNLEAITSTATDEARSRATQVTMVFQELNSIVNIILERLALTVAGPETKKTSKTSHNSKGHHHHHRNSHSTPNSLSPTPILNQRGPYKITQRYTNSVSTSNGSQT